MANSKPITEFTEEELASEEWRAVVGGDNKLFVSNLGRVKSDNLRGRAGRVRVATLRGRRLGVNVRVYGVVTTKKVHKLVADAFLGAGPTGAEVNHIDCNRLNNRASNLEWVTPGRNREHYAEYMSACYRERGHHTLRSGGNRKLSPEVVVDIRRERASGVKLRELASRYSVTVGAIRHAVSGRTWGWVVRD